MQKILTIFIFALHNLKFYLDFNLLDFDFFGVARMFSTSTLLILQNVVESAKVKLPENTRDFKVNEISFLHCASTYLSMKEIT